MSEKDIYPLTSYELNVWHPVARTPCQAGLVVLSIEGCRCARKQRLVDVLEGIDTDYGIETAGKAAGNDWDDATPGADVELGRLRPEAVRSHE